MINQKLSQQKTSKALGVTLSVGRSLGRSVVRQAGLESTWSGSNPVLGGITETNWSGARRDRTLFDLCYMKVAVTGETRWKLKV